MRSSLFAPSMTLFTRFFTLIIAVDLRNYNHALLLFSCLMVYVNDVYAVVMLIVRLTTFQHQHRASSCHETSSEHCNLLFFCLRLAHIPRVSSEDEKNGTARALARTKSTSRSN